MCSEAVVEGAERICFKLDRLLEPLHLYCCHVCQNESRRFSSLDLLCVHTCRELLVGHVILTSWASAQLD